MLSVVLLCVFLLQVALLSDGATYQYEDLTIVEDSPVNADLTFTANHSHLYVMTTDKVCDAYTMMLKFSNLWSHWTVCDICLVRR